jgi:hypothetical protein
MNKNKTKLVEFAGNFITKELEKLSYKELHATLLQWFNHK